MRVLVVEDNVGLCTLYSRVLEQIDAEIMLAHSCQSAIDTLQESVPQLVLLDMSLPDGSGQRVIDHIKSYLPENATHIIVISGNEYRRNKELMDSVDEVLLKPVSTIALLDTVQQINRIRAA